MEQSIQTLIVINLFSVLLQDKLIVAKEGERIPFSKVTCFLDYVDFGVMWIT